MNDNELTLAEQEDLKSVMTLIPADVDAIFLPGKFSSSDRYLTILHLNTDAGNDKSCMEIEYVNADRVLQAYCEADGDAKAFFAKLPNRFNRKQEREDYGTRAFYDLAKEFHNADYYGIWTPAGAPEDEMLFMANWAKLYEKAMRKSWHSGWWEDPLVIADGLPVGSVLWGIRKYPVYGIEQIWCGNRIEKKPTIMHGVIRRDNILNTICLSPLKNDGTPSKKLYNTYDYEYFLTERAAQKAYTAKLRKKYSEFCLLMDGYLKERETEWNNQ